jgi:acyl-homoserine-lactone acylase
MKLFVVWVVLAATAGGTAAAATDQETRWQRHAEDVRIVRDNWGIAHIYGKTDADAYSRDLRPSGG